MGKVYSLNRFKTYGKFLAEITNQNELKDHLFTAKNEYKRQLLKPNNKGNDCQVVHIDFKNK